jgi:hypothetical protein
VKRILVLTTVVLVFALLAIPVSAQSGPQVIMQGSGQVEIAPPTPGGGPLSVGVSLHIDTSRGAVSARYSIPGGFMANGQLVTGMYTVGNVTGCTVDGSTVTVDIEGQTYLLPSREPMGPPGQAQLVGSLTGPGNRGTITVFVPEVAFTIPGTIIIR